MYDAIEDPYTYKNSTVLINKLDLQNQAELDAFETEISSARAAEPLPDGRLDFVHYKDIHHHLFQDVYRWAGQVRTVRISKAGNPFCFPEHVEGQANRLFDDLRSEDYFRNLAAQTFANKAAHFLAELNAIQPSAKETADRSLPSSPYWPNMRAIHSRSRNSILKKCWQL